MMSKSLESNPSKGRKKDWDWDTQFKYNFAYPLGDKAARAIRPLTDSWSVSVYQTLI